MRTSRVKPHVLLAVIAKTFNEDLKYENITHHEYYNYSPDQATPVKLKGSTYTLYILAFTGGATPGEWYQ